MTSVLDHQAIIVVDDHNDVLSSAYLQKLSDGINTYPSVDHYALSHVLLQLGLGANIEKIMKQTGGATLSAVRKIIKENVPVGMRYEKIREVAWQLRERHTRTALRLRVRNDTEFAEALLETGQGLIVVCDARDTFFGIGMDAFQFTALRSTKSMQPSTLLGWMQNEGSCPLLKMGRNRLGIILMDLREDIRAAQMEQLVYPEEPPTPADAGIDRYPLCEHVQTLNGALRALSPCYALPLVVKRNAYTSIQHYVFVHVLHGAGAEPHSIHKVRTVVRPCDVATVAWRELWMLLQGKTNLREQLQQVRGSIQKFYEKATECKFELYPLLKKLLLSTGTSILIDTHRPCGVDGVQLMQILAKPWCTAAQIALWMNDKNQPEILRKVFNGNSNGILLMKIRGLLADACDDKQLFQCYQNRFTQLPVLPSYQGLISQHLICFTQTSILHPCYLSEITIDHRNYPSVQHYLLIEAIDYFGMHRPTREDILNETSVRRACATWYKYFVSDVHPPVEQLEAWFYTDELEALCKGLRCRFEQHRAHLRNLIDTDDALLVFCSRPGGHQMHEWSCGMREKDLRYWMQITCMSTGQLIDLMSQSPSQRPPMLGANRLGMLLVELRKEFQMRGLDHSALPESFNTPESILGTHSAMEGVDLYGPYVNDLADLRNSVMMWPSPLILLAKRTDEEGIRLVAFSRPPLPAELDLSSDASAAAVLVDDEMPEDIDDLKMVLNGLRMRVQRMIVARQQQHHKLILLKNENERLTRIKEMRQEPEKYGASVTSLIKSAALSDDAAAMDKASVESECKEFNDITAELALFAAPMPVQKEQAIDSQVEKETENAKTPPASDEMPFDEAIIAREFEQSDDQQHSLNEDSQDENNDESKKTNESQDVKNVRLAEEINENVPSENEECFEFDLSLWSSTPVKTEEANQSLLKTTTTIDTDETTLSESSINYHKNRGNENREPEMQEKAPIEEFGKFEEMDLSLFAPSFEAASSFMNEDVNNSNLTPADKNECSEEGEIDSD